MLNKQFKFNNLSFGDLIIAKRNTDISKIETGHRTGPFLVIGRKDNFLECLYATSKEKDNVLITIKRNNCGLYKETHITSKVKLISINEFLSSIYSLNEQERKNLIKVFYINEFGDYKKFPEPHIEIGDIIQKKCQHLIISEKEDNYITLKIEYDNVRKSYVVDCKNQSALSKNDKYKRVGFLFEDEIKRCLEDSKNTSKFKSDTIINRHSNEIVESPLKIGNLVLYKEKLFYLYYELGDKSFSFAVNKKAANITSEKITIGGNIYFADFENKQDFETQQDDVILVGKATDEEKQLIKSKRCKKRLM